MRFDELHERILPRLRKIARFYNRCRPYIDKDDLRQEMEIYIWKKYKDGLPQDITIAYVIKGCEFHILNYLRKEKDKVILLSIEKPINEEGGTFKDILPDTREPLGDAIERNSVLEKIMNNGFSKMEKKVFSLLVKGHTVREAAKRLSISHVMVVKYKKNIIKKYHRKGYQN